MANKFKPHDLDSIQDADIKGFIRAAIRSIIIKQYSKNRKLKGFSLPGTSYSFETDMIDTFNNNIDFTCVESNKKTYEKSLKSIAENYKDHIKLFHTIDLQYFQKNQNEQFNFLWLDYCGPISPNKLKSIRLILKNNLTYAAGTPLVGLTFMDRADFQLIHEIKKTSLMYWDKYAKELDPKANIRIAGIPGMINDIANKENKEVYPRVIFEYRDRSRDANAKGMILFIFEVLDGIRNLPIWDTNIFNMISLLTFK